MLNKTKREQFLSDLKDLLDMHDDTVYCTTNGGPDEADKEFQAELDSFIEKYAPKEE